jgi:glutamine synthetase
MSIFAGQPAVKLPGSQPTLENVSKVLEADTKVKLGGIDIDGVLRGKLMSKKKFLSVVRDGFGFCSVVFGWDMHDLTYFRELKISNKENGYGDIVARIDLASFRRIPWEDNVPFFLVSFYDPSTDKRVSACPRGLLARMVEKVEEKGFGALAGGTYFAFSLSEHAYRDLTPSADTEGSRVRVLPVPCSGGRLQQNHDKLLHHSPISPEKSSPSAPPSYGNHEWLLPHPHSP